MWLLALLTSPAPADNPVRIEVDMAVHGQAFVAPAVEGGQPSRLFGGPTVGGEIELRNDQFGVRAHAGLWPIPFFAHAGLIGLMHFDTASLSRFAGVEVTTGYAYRHPRVSLGPTVGVRGPWRAGQLNGVVGVRLSVGLAYDVGSSNDWVFLNPGATLGLHAGLALTFSAGD
ncbi:MAG: hypothetical protein AB8H79_05640 [Myxococcota bacterium]